MKNKIIVLAVGLALAFSVGCGSVGTQPVKFDASKIDVQKLTETGAGLVSALVLANNPTRADEILAVADTIDGFFVDGEITDALMGEAALRLGAKLFPNDPGKAVLVATAVRSMWSSVRPAFGDGPILATDSRFKDAVGAFTGAVRQAVNDFKHVQGMS